MDRSIDRYRFRDGPCGQPPACASVEPEEHFLQSTTAQAVYPTKKTRAHTHRELIREWLREPKGSSLEYIEVLRGGVDAATL